MGEALWPARFTREDLLKIKALDDRFFQALFQNNPRGSDDVMFDVKRVKWVDDVPDGDCFWTVDLATSRTETADYSVLARWVYVDDVLYLVDSRRERVTFAEMRGRLLDVSNTYAEERIVFPKELLELLMIQDLRRTLPAGAIKAVAMKGDKVQKAGAVATLVANYRFAAACAADNNDFVRELGEFPQGRFDDCVDAAAVAAHHVGVPGEFELITGAARGYS